MPEVRTMLLTGASRGIGHATVKRFSAEGWRVLTCSRAPFDERCPWPGGAANHVVVDLSDPEDTMAAIEAIRERVGGRLHALVNNAGVSPKGPEGERLDTLSTDLRTWGRVFHVNFFASVVLARGLCEELAAGPRRGGQRHLHRGQPGASLRGRGLRHLQGRAQGAHA